MLRLGLCVLAVLFAVALAAPLLADNMPLLMRVAGKWSSPALTAFLRPNSGDAAGVDAFFNAALLVAPPAALVAWLAAWTLRIRRDPARRNRLTALAISLAAIATLVTAWLLQANPPVNWQRINYRAAATTAADNDWYIFPPLPFSPLRAEREPPLAPPSARHWLGTDPIGRDVLARIVHGARISLSIGLASASVALLIGVIVGATAGYYGGWVDALILRVIEVMMCFPVLVLILTLLAIARPGSLLVIMLVLGLTGWTRVARQVRGEFLRQRALEYVSAARALGGSAPRVIFVHILPNAIQPALVTATFGVAAAILYESTLSFLGLGVAPPTASWGGMVHDASRHVADAPQLALWPGLAIFVTIVSYNLVAEGLRDRLDPRGGKRGQHGL